MEEAWVNMNKSPNKNNNSKTTNTNNQTKMTKTTPIMKLNITNTQKKLNEVMPSSDGLVETESKMRILIYEEQQTAQMLSLAQTFDLMENLDHSLFHTIAKKQTSKLIPLNYGEAEPATCAITARCSEDHRIGSVIVQQMNEADEILENVGNALPTDFNIMQQMFLRCRKNQQICTNRTPMRKTFANTATLLLVVGRAKLEMKHDKQK